VLLSEGQSLRLGEKPHDALTPGIPFGTDMMVAIVSSAQLFTAPLPDAESVTDFAASLQTALNTLQSSGGSAAAGIAILDTVQGPKR
jgi:hypothetical protein